LISLSFSLQKVSLNKLNILDFGGGLRTTYDQHKRYLTDIISWNIVERSDIVDYALNNNKYINLFYYKNIKDYSKINSITDLIFLSASLQYCKDPFSILDELIALRPTVILIDRVSFSINDEEDYLMIENVPKSIYNASYPIWIFNKKKLIQYIEKQNYIFSDSFNSADKLSYDIEWISIIFVKNEN
jgi:putative methyltransferase (TIGR04325 family)